MSRHEGEETMNPSHPCHRFLSILLAMTSLLAMPLNAHSRENACSFLPAEARTLSEPRLCRLDAGDGHGLAVCRDYSDDHRLYQVVFQGGTSPIVVYESAGVRFPRQAQVITNRHDTGIARCELARPTGIPAAADYRGTGVCDDESGQPLPCSLFEHQGAREPEKKRYFVYYDPTGRGVQQIVSLSAGANSEALEAELAFQLAQALDQTRCCQDLARAYQAHAQALFPDEPLYNMARPQAQPDPREQMAARKPDCGNPGTAGLAAGQ